MEPHTSPSTRISTPTPPNQALYLHTNRILSLKGALQKLRHIRILTLYDNMLQVAHPLTPPILSSLQAHPLIPTTLILEP